MAIGTVTQHLRPLRMAFLVNPSIRQDVLNAIRLSSLFWGGEANPIIPCYGGRLPATWSRHAARAVSSKGVIAGYIDGFDPDIIVPVSKGTESMFEPGSREVVMPHVLTENLARTGGAEFGIGALELLDNLAEKEFKFVRSDKLTVILPSFDKRYDMFLSSVFGDWTSEVRAAAKTLFAGRIPILEPRCSIMGFEKHLVPENLTPRRIGGHALESRPREACVYCLDATSPLDVIDYWNLRAAGNYVLPAPKQSFESKEFAHWVARFVEWNYSVDPDRNSHTIFQVGRSLDEGEATAFISLAGIKNAKDERFRYSVRPWYPRLWDKWARENASEGPASYFSSEVDTSIDGDLGRVNLKPLAPEFLGATSRSSRPKYVNEVSYRVYGTEMPMAEVLPDTSMDLSHSFGYWHRRRARISRSGITYCLSSTDSRIHLEIPEAEPFMLEWFQSSGWEVELSSPGLIATQMLKRLKGEGGLYTICSEGLLKLLDRHASEKKEHDGPDAPRSPKWITEKTLIAEVGKLIKKEGLHFDSARYIGRLLEGNVIRLGLELHCPTCLRWMWKPVESLSEEVECEQCLSRFSLSAAPPRERSWSYKPHGPFNVRGYAGGAYSVLLTWRFFIGNRMKRTTPLLSFNAKKDCLSCEVDLALLCESGGWRASRSELIFCECKAYDLLKKGDISRMEVLGRNFPGAFLVFAKFSEELDSSEVRLISGLAVRQRRLRRAGRPYCHVLVLTGTELFAHWAPPECWKGKGERFENWSHLSTLSDLAEATQAIYLHMDPFHKWEEELRKR